MFLSQRQVVVFATGSDSKLDRIHVSEQLLGVILLDSRDKTS